MIQLLSALFGVVFSVFETIIGGFADLVVSASPSKRNQNYNADFISSDKVLSTGAKGFCLTGDKCLSIKESFSNGLIFGGSGSGKSSRILIPSILKMAGASSLCIHDPSGELFEKSSGAMKNKGYTIKVLNYADGGSSENFNPLYRVKNISDIKKISKLLIQTSLGGGGKDPFWNASAESLLAVFIRYVLFHTEEQYHTLYSVLTLINAFSGTPQKVDKLFVQAKDDDLLSDYKAFVAYDSKMLMSIVATVRTALSIFADPGVARVTSSDTIDFGSFRKGKTILYINNNVNDMKYYSVLSSIFFEQFFASVMSKLPKQNDLPIFFLLDEASSLYLSILPTAISNIRKYDAGILQIYQSQSQLLDLYGVSQARNIIANSYAKNYMSGQPLETARELESILGKYEYVDDENNRRTRQLLTMDEIRILSESIILVGNMPPIKARMIPYYEQNELNRLSQISPPEIESKYYDDKLEQINLNPNGQKE
jgi:type IV secretory pathway TraG/TraD family ATPase VirD4